MTKDQILAEIRRTAAENNGETLGRKRIEAETGIAIGDWSRFWARWSDAVSEAGVAPNEFNEALDNVLLLDCLFQITRDLGRLPAFSDLRLRKHQDESFPSHNVFRRLGSKEQLVAQLAEHCRGKGGGEDVLAQCEAYLQDKRRDEKPKTQVPTPDVEFGFVYLFKSGRFYKLGRSNSVGRREYELAIQLPQPVTQVHAIRTDDPPGIETYWHNRFSTDVRAFKRRKFM